VVGLPLSDGFFWNLSHANIFQALVSKMKFTPQYYNIEDFKLKSGTLLS